MAKRINTRADRSADSEWHSAFEQQDTPRRSRFLRRTERRAESAYWLVVGLVVLVTVVVTVRGLL